MKRSNTYIIGKIYLVAGMSLFLLASSFYFLGYKPLAEQLFEKHDLEIDSSLASSLWRVQDALSKHHDLSRQSASRTAIRNKQIAYLRGKTSLKDLKSFSLPKLADAMRANEDIVGIARFDPNGKLLFNVGEHLSAEIIARCAIPRLDKIRMLYSLHKEGVRWLYYCSPIVDADFGKIGADILTFKDNAIQHIIDTQSTGAIKEMAVSLVSDNHILYWPRTQTGSDERSVLENYLKSGISDREYQFRSKVVEDTGWKLYAVINQKQFFADIKHHLFKLMSVVGGLAIILLILTIAVLRPLIRSLLREDQLVDLSIHDGLTGLYNHAYMEESLNRELARTRRHMRVLSILMLDIDYFKKVNDTHGHLAGDEVLRFLAQLIQRSARKQDIASRYGGEEFTLILPETAQEDAAVLAERLRANVASSRIMTKAGEIGITISIGVVTYDTSMGDITQHKIMDAADKALYASKEGGRNRVSVAVLQAGN